MTADDRPRFARCLAVLGEVFSEAISELRAEAYFHAFEDLPVERVEAAADVALRVCRFFPKPAEWRDLAVGGSLADRSELAWAEMQAAAREGRSPEFRDPIAARALLTVWGTSGWRRDYHDRHYRVWEQRREEFLAAYRAHAMAEALGPTALPPGSRGALSE